MVGLLPPDTDLLGGLELGGVPIATMVSSLTGRPALFVRKEGQGYGTCKARRGAGRRRPAVTLVEDVITTGGAVRDATNALRAAGATVEVVVCAIDRSPAGENPLADVGLECGRCSPRPSSTPRGAPDRHRSPGPPRPVGHREATRLRGQSLDLVGVADPHEVRLANQPGKPAPAGRPAAARSQASWPDSGGLRPGRLQLGGVAAGGGCGRGGGVTHSQAMGMTVKARIAMSALSMFSPRLGNAWPRV